MVGGIATAVAPAPVAPVMATEGAEVLSLAYDTFMEGKIHLHKDLADHERLLEVQAGDSAELEE